MFETLKKKKKTVSQEICPEFPLGNNKDEILFPVYCVLSPEPFPFPDASLKCSGSSPDTKRSRLLHLVTVSLITAHLWECNQSFTHLTGSFSSKVFV